MSEQLDDRDDTFITTQLGGDELESVVKKINLVIKDGHRAKAEIGREQAALKRVLPISHTTYARCSQR